MNTTHNSLNIDFLSQWKNNLVKTNKIKVVSLEELSLLDRLNRWLPIMFDGEFYNEKTMDIEQVLETSSGKELFYLAAIAVTLKQKHSKNDVCFKNKHFKDLKDLKKVPRLDYGKSQDAFNSLHDLVTFAYRRIKYICKPKMRSLQTNEDHFKFYQEVFDGAYVALTQWYGKDFEDLQVKSLLSVLMKQKESSSLYRLIQKR